MTPNLLFSIRSTSNFSSDTLTVVQQQSTQGTQLFLTLICKNGHKYFWSSQPMIEGMAAGNVLLSSSILPSDSTYTKVASLADILKWKFFGERTFYNIQDKYLSPVINEFCIRNYPGLFPLRISHRNSLKTWNPALACIFNSRLPPQFSAQIPNITAKKSQIPASRQTYWGPSFIRS